MKKWIPWVVIGAFAAWLLSGLRTAKQTTEFNVAEFGRLPVLLAGRIQPLDSVGLNALVSMRGKRTVGKEERQPGDSRFKRIPRIDATTWLLETLIRPEEADQYKIFRVQHPDLENMLGGRAEGLEYYSFGEILNNREVAQKIIEQAQAVLDAEEAKKSEPSQRTPYQKDLVHLYQGLQLYQMRLKISLVPNGSPRFVEEFREAIASASAALRRQEADGGSLDAASAPASLGEVQRFRDIFQHASRAAYPLMIPRPEVTDAQGRWTTIGASLYESPHVQPPVEYYGRIAVAWAEQNAPDFNRAVAEYKQWLASNGFGKELTKGRWEFFFNRYELFYKTSVIYVAALLLGCAFWLNFSEPVRKAAFGLLGLAFAVHTFGLLFRMVLEGRPPVTNLYSSAIFVGWGATGLGLLLERFFRDGIGIVAAAFVGFATLIIAHHLSLSGDTMIMLQAVLDTNFWLATHVVVITAGYSSMFLAGILAILYIVRGVFTRSLTDATAKALSRMVYGIICFSTLFSFVGTILGGIWADQSWGRFWGWDPKENGALLIVIWCAVILHARWGGLIRDRGLMAMAVFGGIVTSFSWFGTNMLGVGLHAYGFMDAAFKWLIGFMLSQLLFIGLAMLPLAYWKSFKSTAPAD